MCVCSDSFSLLFFFSFFVFVFFLKAYRILIDVRSQLERLEMFSSTIKDTSPADMKSRFRAGLFCFFVFLFFCFLFFVFLFFLFFVFCFLFFVFCFLFFVFCFLFFVFCFLFFVFEIVLFSKTHISFLLFFLLFF